MTVLSTCMSTCTAVLLAMAACGGGSHPVTRAGDSAPAVEADGSASASGDAIDAPARTPPTIARTGSGELDVQGLPAIAAGGEVVVFASDGRVEVRSAFDVTARKLVVPATGGDLAPLDRELATLDGVYRLRPLRALPVEAAHDGEDQHWATGDNLDVEWREHHLRVFPHNAMHALADRDCADWIAPAGCATAYLAGVAHLPPSLKETAAHNTVLVEIGFRGTAACPAPHAQQHVISWARAPR